MSASATSVGPDDPTVALVDGRDRLTSEFGHTTISPLVCEKIAARSATEVEGVSMVQAGVARLVPWSAPPAGGAAADVRGHTVSIDLSVSVRYPQPVLAAAREVRRRVTERLGELAGLTVGSVAVTVAELSEPGPGRRRRVE